MTYEQLCARMKELDAIERNKPANPYGYSPPEYTCQRCGCKAIGWACGCERFNESTWGER